MNKQQKKTQKRAHYEHKDQGSRITMYSMATPVATRLRTVLKYSENLQPTTTSLYEYTFNLNSLFDPNRTGVGHQPMGYDQLTPLYGRYRVYRVWYDITWINANSDPSIIIAVPSNSASGIGSITTALEMYNGRHSKAGNMYTPMSLKGFVDLAVLNGKTTAQYTDDDTTSAITSTSPSEILILHTCFYSLSNTVVSGSANVDLRFECEFSDPLQLSAS